MLSLFKNRSFFMRLAAVALTISATMLDSSAAFAGAAAPAPDTGTSAITFTQLNGTIGAVETFLTGPIAHLMALMSIIVGAIMFFQGREMSEGLKIFGVIAITLGLLTGFATFFPSLGASI